MRWPTLGVVGLLATSACSIGLGDARETERVERAVLATRVTVGRLSGQRGWTPCTVTDSIVVAHRYRCDGLATAHDASLHGPPSTDTSTHAIHLRALVDLRFMDTTRASAARVVSALERASARTTNDARVWNNLAVAYMALAEREQTLGTMLKALDAIERSIQIDSSAADARFNRALVYERLHLVGSARTAWLAFLVADTSRAWKAEARQHLASLPATAEGETFDGLLRTLDIPDDIATRAQRSPRLAREFGPGVLREWGLAVLSGDDARASRALELTRVVGSALADAQGDEGLVLTVRAIDRLKDDRIALRRAASASVELGAGIQHYSRFSFDTAALKLDEAGRALSSLGLRTAGWADFYRGASSINVGRYAEGDSAFTRILRNVSPTEPALAGKTLLALGVSQIRRGNYDAAIRWYREALPRISASREAINVGFSTFLLSEALDRAGLPQERDEQSYRALHLLAPFRRSNYLSNLLTQIAAESRAKGLHHAALAVTNEMLNIARSTDKADVMALAYCARARDFAAVGRIAEANSDLRTADHWSRQMPRERGFDRIRGAVLLATGEVLQTVDPQRALPVLRRAVAAFRVFERDNYLPESQYQAAEAAREAGRNDEAHALLTDAIRSIQQQESWFQSEEGRIAFAETSERIFDAMIGLEARAQHPSIALDYLERARAITWLPAARAAAAIKAPADGAMALIAAKIPKGELLVEYAVLRDRLLVWSIGATAQRFVEIRVSRDSLTSLVNGITSGASGTATDMQRTRLFELLLLPVAKELAAARSVTIVPDRELYRVPFAALIDARTHTFAVELAGFRMAPSAAFYLDIERAPASSDSTSRTLAIGDPSLTADERLRYPELPGADAEARAVGQLYASSTVLTDRDATRSSFLRMAPGAGILHFAGHAVLDANRPSRSYLMLAADGSTPGTLEAREIAELHLSSVRLVVLSACSTLNAHASHAGGITGLAYSFLRAGAPATVSTLWDINDQSATPLLVDFHRELARQVPVADALRSAQLRALHSVHAELRDPRVWGAFTYTGP